MAQHSDRKWHLRLVVRSIVCIACCCGWAGQGVLLGQEAAPPATQAPYERGESVKPGINREFLDPELAVDEWIERFETESREVFNAREAIVDALKLEEGMRVADVGAGTGLFTRLFAHRVGPRGAVFAVDISPRFVEHLARVARRSQPLNITPVLCAEDAVLLPPESIDLVYACDTYHHFEYPAATLASIRRALVPGGRLAVIDFERIPGVSREWTLDHVRAGKETFRSEIEAAGFELVTEIDLDGLEENYFLIFCKRQ